MNIASVSTDPGTGFTLAAPAKPGRLIATGGNVIKVIREVVQVVESCWEINLDSASKAHQEHVQAMIITLYASPEPLYPTS